MPQNLPSTKPTLVIVDDDADQLSLAQMAAQRVGVYRQVIMAEDGLEALREIGELFGSPSAASPLIILTDLKMPRVGGIELAKRLQREPGIPVHLVAMSNTRYKPEIEAALAAGCCAFFQKPSGFTELKAMLSSLPEICANGVAHEAIEGNLLASLA